MTLDVIERPGNGDGPAGDDENGGVVEFVTIGQHLAGSEPKEAALAGIIDEQQESSCPIEHNPLAHSD